MDNEKFLKLEVPIEDNLARRIFAFSMFAICLALPNIIYSGVTFFQTLHLMKWVFSLVPLALMMLNEGVRSFFDDEVCIKLRIDFFGWFWFAYLLFITLQPQWVSLKSVPGWQREWFFFAGCWAFYLIAFSLFRNSWLRPILWLASLCAALNGIIAECQIRNFVKPFGSFALIMQTPGNYIGNTGQQNMLGLWLAIALFSSLFLFVIYGDKFRKGWKNKAAILLNLLFFSIITWCLWNSTSRSAILGFFVGIIAFWALLFFSGRDRSRLRRFWIGVLVFVIVCTINMLSHGGEGWLFWDKSVDMFKNWDTFGGRIEIWKTSVEVFRTHPYAGVGLGQYKWHYLLGEHLALLRYPAMSWQFTYWAHNEILQWFCEFGIPGGLALLAMGALWLIALFRYVRVWGRKGLPEELLWSAAFLFLIWFDALWTRPFHRIENSLWISLAFALSNRHLFFGPRGIMQCRSMPTLTRLIGLLLIALSIGGLYYGIDGIRGDLALRAAADSKDSVLKERWVQIARRSYMVKDLADRELALLTLKLGETKNNMEILAQGLNQLIDVFRQEPTMEDLQTLSFYAHTSRIKDLQNFLAPYQPPAGSSAAAEAEVRLRSLDAALLSRKQGAAQHP